MSKFIQLTSDGQRMAFNVESIEAVSAVTDSAVPANMPDTINTAIKLRGTNQIHFVDQLFGEIMEMLNV